MFFENWIRRKSRRSFFQPYRASAGSAYYANPDNFLLGLNRSNCFFCHIAGNIQHGIGVIFFGLAGHVLNIDAGFCCGSGEGADGVGCVPVQNTDSGSIPGHGAVSYTHLFAGIVARLPSTFNMLAEFFNLAIQSPSTSGQYFVFVPLFVVLFLAVIWVIVFMQDSERPVSYTHLPVKVLRNIG